MNTHIDILRHGAVMGGECFRGRRDDPLTAAGWRQMATALAGAGPWDAVVSSPLRRCALFAARVGTPLWLDPRWQELDFGAWEGLSAAEIMARDATALTRFWDDPLSCGPPRGETLVALAQRVGAAWDELIRRHSGQRVLLVTHGGPIRVLLCQLLGRPLRRCLALNVPLASRHQVTLTEGDKRCTVVTEAAA
ncbi:MAG TPA: histidine phosphatase family protein [Gammaproteobacteria bacterium]|nr:histidine phosphatase family protein [Gammaproteobacteria bacterium]